MIEQSLTSMRNLNIVVDQVHSFMTTMFLENYCIYQQGNAQCHTGRIVREWFNEHSSIFQVMSCPLNSPIKNSIEYLWLYLEISIRAATLPSWSAAELQDESVSTWYLIPQTSDKNFIALIPCWLLFVLKAKDGSASY